MPHYPDEVEYSDKYADDKYEYRHVILPKRIAKDMFRIFQAEAQMRGRGEGSSAWFILFDMVSFSRALRKAVLDGGAVWLGVGLEFIAVEKLLVSVQPWLGKLSSICE
ncbi:Cyclin-dependent kinases regulatory subunit 2 [Perkinsus olseni]|uniref:Cyclin-dependent kinases regulatory subunit n=1 Tax=Perkinsus olseni TaxID=32597 RepID=A0A7J6NMI0_PEROL|nr:Cyclin-dependent kinases regulatory subunit 2 [Perkinsus olseni]